MTSKDNQANISRRQLTTAGVALLGIAATSVGARAVVDSRHEHARVASIINDPNQLPLSDVTLYTANVAPGQGDAAIADKFAPDGSADNTYIQKTLEAQDVERTGSALVNNGNTYVIPDQFIDNPQMVQPGPASIKLP